MALNKLAFLDFLFRRHGKELLAFAGQRSGSETAEDLVQDAYLRLLQHPNPEAIANPRAFLFQITANLTIDHHRWQRLRDGYHAPDNDAGEEAIAQVADHRGTPETRVHRMEELERLSGMLLELPEITRHAFVLCRLEGLSHAEVAERLSISVRSSERHVTKALRHLLTHSRCG